MQDTAAKPARNLAFIRGAVWHKQAAALFEELISAEPSIQGHVIYGYPIVSTEKDADAPQRGANPRHRSNYSRPHDGGEGAAEGLPPEAGQLRRSGGPEAPAS